jgi:hypothetical protein
MYFLLLNNSKDIIRKNKLHNIEIEEVTSITNITNDGISKLPSLRMKDVDIVSGISPTYDVLEKLILSSV